MTKPTGQFSNDARGLSSLVTFGALLRLPLLIAMLWNPEAARQTDDYIRFGAQWLITGSYNSEWFPPLYPLFGGIAAWLAALLLARFGDRGVAVGVAASTALGVAIAGSVVFARFIGGHWLLW